VTPPDRVHDDHDRADLDVLDNVQVSFILQDRDAAPVISVRGMFPASPASVAVR
jgi:hypothetical protein